MRVVNLFHHHGQDLRPAQAACAQRNLTSIPEVDFAAAEIEPRVEFAVGDKVGIEMVVAVLAIFLDRDDSGVVEHAQMVRGARDIGFQKNCQIGYVHRAGAQSPDDLQTYRIGQSFEVLGAVGRRFGVFFGIAAHCPPSVRLDHQGNCTPPSIVIVLPTIYAAASLRVKQMPWAISSEVPKRFSGKP